MRREDWRGRIADMLDAIDRIAGFIAGLDAETFRHDLKARDAVVWNLTVVGEAARAIPDALQARHPDVPWAKMRDTRNLLVHEYFGIDDDIVWATVTRNLLPLAPRLPEILADPGEASSELS